METDFVGAMVERQDVDVVAIPHPFSTKVIRMVVGEHATLEEIVRQAGVPDCAAARVFIEWRGVIHGPIPREQWARIRPKRGRRVVIRAIPTGGGGGDDNKTLRLILAIVVLIIAIAVFWWISGGVWGSIAAMAIMGLGQLAVNALLPPQAPKLGSLAALNGAGTGRAPESPSLSITGSQNKANPYGPVARVYGRHRVFPVFGAVPYSESLGNDQFLRQLFVVGYGPLVLTELKIGDTPIESFEGVEIEVRQGFQDEPPLTLYTNDVSEEAMQVLLLDGQPQSRVGSQPGSELSVDVVFPNGLTQFTGEGNQIIVTVQVKVEFRKFNPTAPAAWVEAPGSPIIATDNRNSQVRKSLFWRVDDEAVYEVRMTRLTGDSTDPLKRDQSVWSSLRTIRIAEPILMLGLCKVALRIRATDQLNGIVDQFNCIASAILPDWDVDTETWITRETQSPAAAYRDALQGPANSRPIPDERINFENLQDWAEACAARNFTYNQVVDFSQTVYQQLQDIAASSRGAFHLVDGKFAVLQDKEQTVPVQHFTPRNSWGFRGTHNFLDRVHGLKMRFVNPDADWQMDEIIVYDDSYDETNASRFEVMPTTGITNADHSWRLGRYHLAVSRLRPELFEFSCDIENLVCTRGDLVMLTHDVLLVGLASGRIKSVAGPDGTHVTAITLDDECPMEVDKSYVVRVRTDTGSTILAPVVTTPGLNKTLTLITPLSGGVLPQVGDIVMFGEAGLESLPCVVKQMAYEKDFIAKVILVAHSPAIYSADTGPIPPYETFISHAPVLHRTPPTPAIDDVRSDESVLSRGLDGTLTPRIVLTVRYLSNSNIPADKLEVQYRRSDSSSPFISLASLPPGTQVISVAPVEQGVAYDIRIRQSSGLGAVSDWAIVLNHTVVGKTSPPPDPIGLTLVGNLLSWSYPTPPPDLLGFEVRQISGTVANWEQGLLLHGGTIGQTSFTVPQLIGIRTLMAKALDTVGNPSLGQASLTVDFGAALLHNIVETDDEHLAGFPGTKVNGIVSGITGDLEATEETSLFWGTNDSALFWGGSDGDLFWASEFQQLRYTWTYVTSSLAAETTLLIDLAVQGAVLLEYKRSVDATWIPFVGVLTGITAATSYDLRVTIDGGPVQGIIATLTLLLDAPDISESLANVAIASGGTRLTLARAYRVIKTAQLTVVHSGAETAITARAEDKNASLGPLVKGYDQAGVAVAAHVDASIVGY